MIWMSVWRTFTLENATTEIDSKALTWCCVELFQTVLIIVNNLSGDSFQNLNCTGVYSVTVKYVKIKKRSKVSWPRMILCTLVISTVLLCSRRGTKATVQWTTQSDSLSTPLTDNGDACCHKHACTEINANNTNVPTRDELITNPMNTNTCKEWITYITYHIDITDINVLVNPNKV